MPRARVPHAVARMGIDRWRLRGTPGLAFHKLLGTGDGTTFSPADADPRTWGLVCSWRARADADRFEAHPTTRGWRRIAEEEFRADLRPLRSRGTWSGLRPFEPGRMIPAEATGPVASITRARLKPPLAATFWRAVPPVVEDLDGPLLRVGIGEAPIGFQGTFTIWPDTDSLVDFAYRRPAHRKAISDTDRLGWYTEELFARFTVVGLRGRIFGRDLTAEPGWPSPPITAAGEVRP